MMGVVLAMAVPGLPLATIAESNEAEQPFEDGDEELQEEAVRRPRRVHHKIAYSRLHGLNSSNENGRRIDILRPLADSLDGHRLANGVCAPLIC